MIDSGEIMLFVGIAGAAVSLLALVFLRIYLSKKEKKLKNQLNSEYFQMF